MGRKTVILLLTFLCVLCFAGCDKKDVEDNVRNVTDAVDEHVIGVKNGYPEAVPEITYGDAFERFFANPTWKYFESTDGKDVVEFTGRCTYMDQEVKARLQFILSDDGKTFEQGAMSFNDVPQSALITSALIYKAFATYAEENDITMESNLEDEFQTETDLYYDENGDPMEAGDMDDGDDASYNSDSTEDYSVGDPPEDEESVGDEVEVEDAYLVPGGDARYIKKEELEYMDKKTLRLARNEFYARHGRKFNDKELQAYFDAQPWYIGMIEPEDFDESVLNKYEKKNIKKLVAAENK